MDYEKSKKQFEQRVSHMQADLKQYAANPKANTAAVETRADNLNALVEYYTKAEERISELEMQLLREVNIYEKLAYDTERLVIFCKIHRINPNMVFHYTSNELNQMYNEGYRITPPVRDLMELITKFDGIHSDVSVPPLEQKVERESPYAQKYYGILSMLNFSNQLRQQHNQNAHKYAQ